MLIQITDKPSKATIELLQTTLNETDQVIVMEKALGLALNGNPFQCPGFIRQVDVQNLGFSVQDSWTVISESEWVQMTIKQSKVVTW